MDRDKLIYNNIWKENYKYSDVPEIVSTLSLESEMKVLDLCAGGGRNTKPLLEKNHKVVAVDRNDVAISELNKLRNVFKNFQVVHADALDFLNNNSEVFDLIIIFDCIHHFCKTTEMFRNAIYSVKNKMNEGSKLLITILTDISYPGGNENVDRLYLNKSEANKILDDTFLADFVEIKSETESVLFNNAENLVDGKLICGEYKAIRLLKLYEKKK